MYNKLFWLNIDNHRDQPKQYQQWRDIYWLGWLVGFQINFKNFIKFAQLQKKYQLRGDFGCPWC